MSRIVSASFLNGVGNVVFDDNSSKEMTYEDYLVQRRSFNPRSIADLIRHIDKKGAFWFAGHGRGYKNCILTKEYYWFEGKDHLTKEEYKKLYNLIKRYQRFCHYIKEIKPEWKDAGKTYYADNSEEMTQIDKYGNKRNIMVKAPSGDACY